MARVKWQEVVRETKTRAVKELKNEVQTVIVYSLTGNIIWRNYYHWTWIAETNTWSRMENKKVLTLDLRLCFSWWGHCESTTGDQKYYIWRSFVHKLVWFILTLTSNPCCLSFQWGVFCRCQIMREQKDHWGHFPNLTNHSGTANYVPVICSPLRQSEGSLNSTNQWYHIH